MRRLVFLLTFPLLAAGCGLPFFGASQLPKGVHLDTGAGRREAFARAYRLYRRDDLQRALRIFSALATQYPELADYNLYFAGVINQRLGRTTPAQLFLGRLLREYPQSVEAPAAALALGELLVRTGRLQAGRGWLQNALLAPDTGTVRRAQLALAEADEGAGDVVAAYAEYMKVRRAAPGSAADRAAKARVLALRATHPALVPTGAALLVEARLLVAEGDDRGAKRAVDQLVESGDAVRSSGIEPSDVLRVLADALFGMGENRRGLAVLRELVERYPASAAAPRALFQRATLLWNRDRDDEALQAFTEFHKRYPRDAHVPDVLYAIGRIHEQAGRARQAIATYTDLAHRYPRSSAAGEARWRTGWIFYRRRHWAAAVTAFAALSHTPATARQESEGRYWQARALARGGHAAAARRLYRQIVERDPNGYYGMWAARRLGIAAPLRAAPGAASLALTAAQPAVGAAPFADTFHVERWQELAAAGVNGLARRELAAIAHRHNDQATTLYLLRAYPTVDGFAAAIHLLRRRDAAAGLSSAQRQRLLYPLAFWPIVRREGQANSVDPLLIEAVIRQESLFNPLARSRADARGLMQLLPVTAARVEAWSSGRREPVDLTVPEENIGLGVRELSGLLTRFGGNVLKAVAAYNGGVSAVEKWERRAPDAPDDEFVESISYRETRDYVKRVVTNYRTYSHLYRVAAP